MKKLLLIAVALLAAVAALGVVIDIQSSTRVVRPERPAESSQIFASGRIEGATAEIELRPQLAGRITHVSVAEGQVVNEGDELQLKALYAIPIGKPLAPASQKISFPWA